MNERALVAIPTRGRPRQLKDMLTAGLDLSEGRADFAVGTDADDPSTGAYQDFLLPLVRTGRVLWYQRERSSPSDLVNHIAKNHARDYFAVGYYGDDHIPQTGNWIGELMESVGSIGGSGIAYGNDRYQTPRLPTAAFITSDVGTGAGCLVYREDVIIEHLHHTIGKSPSDLTYVQAAGWWDSDTVAYRLWCDRRREADTEKVRRVVQARRGVV